MQNIQPFHYGPVTLNGVANVEICPAPAAGKTRQVFAIRVTNLDTLAVAPILKFNVSAARTEIDRVPMVPSTVTDSGLACRERPIHLIGDTQSLDMALAAAITTSNPTVHVEGIEGTDDV